MLIVTAVHEPGTGFTTLSPVMPVAKNVFVEDAPGTFTLPLIEPLQNLPIPKMPA